MPVRSALKQHDPITVACVVVALVSTYAFLQEIIAPHWPAWVLSPTLVLAFLGAKSLIPEDSVSQIILNQAALLTVPFMAFYSVAEELFAADWLEWGIPPLLALGFWLLVATIADFEIED